MWPKSILILSCLLLAACQSFTLVEAKKQTIGGTYSVEAQIQWNKMDEQGVELWTVDGPLLQSLRFVSEVKDGDALFTLPRAPGSAEQQAQMPTYRDDFSLSETVEFIIASLERYGANQIKASHIRPAKFGSADGIRFEFTFLTEEGLESDGIATAATIDAELFVVIYSGTHEYYFPKYKDQVERLLASIALVDGQVGYMFKSLLEEERVGSGVG